MLRRTILAAVAGALALLAAAPAVGAAPALPADDDAWAATPVYDAEWVAGPKTDGTAEPRSNGLALSALTADSCDVVLPDPTVDMVKTADRTQLSPTQMRLRVTLDTTAAGGEFRLRDCIWIDDGDGVWQEATETLFGIDLEPVVWAPDTSDGVGSFARFRVNLPVTAEQDVCDRAARSELEGETAVPFLRSNTLCLPGAPGPVVPESAVAVLLPLTAVAIGGGYLAVRRRRNASTA